jgi:hypothetical protein
MTTQRFDFLLSAKDATAAAFASVGRNFSALQTQATAAASTLTTKVGAIGAAVTTAFAAIGASRSLDLLDQLDKMREKTGVSVETLSEFRYAAELSGVSLDTLGGALGKLAKLMAEAAGGNKEAKATFEAIGVSVTDANGKLRGTDEVLREVAQRFSGYEDGAGKAALATRLFGKSGAELIPLLNGGAVGLAQMANEAKKLGAVFDGETAKAAVEFKDNLDKLKMASEAASIAIAGPLVKALATLTSDFIEAKKNGEGFTATLKLLELVNPSTALIGWAKLFSDTGQAAAKSTADIQAYVNALGGANAGGGRGFVNPNMVAPVVGGGEEQKKQTRGGGVRTDPLAEAKRYLETLQKQAEKLQELTTEEQALRDITMGRLGAVSPALQAQILATARQIDLDKAHTEGLKEAKRVAEEAADAAARRLEEAEALRLSVLTPLERYNETVQNLERIGRDNPLVSNETLNRLRDKAWADYSRTIEGAGKELVKLDEFAERAATNIQDYLGNTFQQLMEGNFKDVGRAFTSMINRMVAEAAAAQLSRYLFGDLTKGGEGDGLLGGFMKSLFGGIGGGGKNWATAGGGGFGTGAQYGNLDFGGFFAEGGTLQPGRWGIAGENGPERIYAGAVPLTVFPNEGGSRRAGNTIIINHHAAPGQSRATAMQDAARIRRMLESSGRNL